MVEKIQFIGTGLHLDREDCIQADADKHPSFCKNLVPGVVPCLILPFKNAQVFCNCYFTSFFYSLEETIQHMNPVSTIWKFSALL